MFGITENIKLNSLKLLLCLAVTGCGEKEKKMLQFSTLESSHTGVDFVNNITDTDTLNILDYLYYYNGAGLSTGDINNDGLPDLYFVSNREKNRLYLNKGNFQFEDITDRAGVGGSGEWNTGANMADVNGDGFLDIYLCTVGAKLLSTGKMIHGKNQLFINNGDNSFTERAAEYGLDYSGFSTQTLFFDYDKDGDPDMFLLNHSVHSNENYGDTSIRRKLSAESGDKLFRNDNGRFQDVTPEAGIISSSIGYGLGVSAGDFNHDGWDDLYVANDFHENDYYYLNNGNGTFSENIRNAFGHTSRFSMGTEAADLNNDGWLDIISTDMLPADEKLLKSSNSDDPLEIYNLKMNFGYYHQYSRNALQLNVGKGRYFSDIGLLAGISATDWTWNPLAADFDNDGIKDLYFSNGIIRRLTNLDYIRFYADASLGKALKNSRRLDKSVIERMPPGEAVNYMFKGTDSLLFHDVSGGWGFTENSISTGAAYADLDNDGDIDIITNNINSPAGLYRNNESALGNGNYLSISLRPGNNNAFVYGTKVYLKNGNDFQFQQLYPVRGFMSCSEPVLHFGLGSKTAVDTILIIWPDGSKQEMLNVTANRKLVITKGREENSSYRVKGINEQVKGDDFAFTDAPVFKDITAEVALPFLHRENDFIDFVRQPMMPHMQSALGPKVAVADVNGDGLDDFYIGGARNQPGRLFIQRKTLQFISTNEPVFSADAASEDVDAVFFDADNDKDPDLYVVSGGNEYFTGSVELNDRLYINDGKGNFSRSLSAPAIATNKSCVSAADIDGDGDTDLFVGARTGEKAYGLVPRSYLLINDGQGRLSESDSSSAPSLWRPGLISAAVFADMDKDGDPDLVLAGDWMSPVIYENEKGRFKSTRKFNLPESPGWWQSITITDIDNDGYPDILAGNYGLNAKLKASRESPLLMYVFDYDKNGVTEQLLAYENKGRYYSFLGKDELEKQIPSIKKKYLRYDDFAGKTVDEIFGPDLKNARILKASDLASTLFHNDGRGHFTAKPLPVLVQSAPIFSILSGDFDGDGKTDLLAGGNFYGVLPYEGRYDALLPALCRGDGKGNFERRLPWESELMIKGEIRDIKKLRIGGGKECVIIARNNDTPVFLTW